MLQIVPRQSLRWSNSGVVIDAQVVASMVQATACMMPRVKVPKRAAAPHTEIAQRLAAPRTLQTRLQVCEAAHYFCCLTRRVVADLQLSDFEKMETFVLSTSADALCLSYVCN